MTIKATATLPTRSVRLTIAKTKPCLNKSLSLPVHAQPAVVKISKPTGKDEFRSSDAAAMPESKLQSNADLLVVQESVFIIAQTPAVHDKHRKVPAESRHGCYKVCPPFKDVRNGGGMSDGGFF